MKTTKMYELSKDNIRAAIFNYIGEHHGHIDDFEIIADDHKNVVRINMNEVPRVSDVRCNIMVCKAT